jgi:hypothetical protein
MAMDNQGAIALATVGSHNRRTRHINVRYHYVRQCVNRASLHLNIRLPVICWPMDLLSGRRVSVKLYAGCSAFSFSECVGASLLPHGTCPEIGAPIPDD